MKTEKTRYIIYLLIFLIAFGSIFIFFTQNTYAEENKKTPEELEEIAKHHGRTPIVKGEADDKLPIYHELAKHDIDSTDSIVNGAFRYLGFGVIKTLAKAVDGLYSTLDSIIDIMSFGYSDEIKTLATKYSTLYKILFIVSLSFFGIYLMLGKSQNQLNTINCIIAIVLIISAYPLFTAKLGELTMSASHYAKSQWVETQGDFKIDSISVNVLKKNVYDLYKLDQNKINGNKISIPQNGYCDIKNQSDYKELDINEYLNPDKYDLKNETVWENQRIKLTDDTYKTVELTNIIMPDTYYYRYQISDWLNPIITLGTTAVVLFLLVLRVFGMIIEIAFSQIYMPFIAVTDIASGQRVKEALKGVLSFFGAIFLAIALFGVFLAGLTFISTKIKNVYLGYVFLLSLAWASINGSTLLERIIGVDVGMRSGWSMIIGATAAAKVGKGVAKVPVSVAKGGFRAGKGMYKAGKGMANAGKKLHSKIAEGGKNLDGKNNNENNDKNIGGINSKQGSVNENSKQSNTNKGTFSKGKGSFQGASKNASFSSPKIKSAGTITSKGVNNIGKSNNKIKPTNTTSTSRNLNKSKSATTSKPNISSQKRDRINKSLNKVSKNNLK